MCDLPYMDISVKGRKSGPEKQASCSAEISRADTRTHTCRAPRCCITSGTNSPSHPDSGLFLHSAGSCGQVQRSVCKSRSDAAEDTSRGEGGPGRRAWSLSFLRRENLGLVFCPRESTVLKPYNSVYEVKHIPKDTHIHAQTYVHTYSLVYAHIHN